MCHKQSPGWEAMGVTPPACPPLLTFSSGPTQLGSKLLPVLLPGQAGLGPLLTVLKPELVSDISSRQGEGGALHWFPHYRDEGGAGI